MEVDFDLDDAYSYLEVKVRNVPIEATKETLQTFAELIGESNELVKKARATDEVIKDAYVVSALTTSIHESTKCINISESNFDPQAFGIAVVNIVSKYDEEEEHVEINWSRLAEKSVRIFRYAPGFTYIAAFKNHEPASQVEKVVEKRVRQTRKTLEACKEPEKVQTITKTDEGVSAMEKILKLLQNCYRQNNRNPLCFFSFVIDPESFSKTIENIFHLSFLARDGHVLISLDRNKLPILTPVRSEKDNANNANQAKVQMLLSLTQSQWRDIVREFNITEATIP